MSSPATIKGLLVLRVTGGNPLLGVLPRVSGVGVTGDTLVYSIVMIYDGGDTTIAMLQFSLLTQQWW